MLNLRDPTFISAAASERNNNTLENTTTHLDLTFVESHNPTTQLSTDRDGLFLESESRGGGDDEEWIADLYLRHPAGKHLFSSYDLCGFLTIRDFLLGNDIELHRTGV
jgi:hypothetical protein